MYLMYYLVMVLNYSAKNKSYRYKALFEIELHIFDRICTFILVLPCLVVLHIRT